jgi:hypothetical protein
MLKMEQSKLVASGGGARPQDIQGPSGHERGTDADSDDRAQAFRFDAAQRSDLIARS